MVYEHDYKSIDPFPPSVASHLSSILGISSKRKLSQIPFSRGSQPILLNLTALLRQFSPMKLPVLCPNRSSHICSGTGLASALSSLPASYKALLICSAASRHE